MAYLFTSESVSEGHPDKIADQISDAILDNFLAFDKNAKVACETLVTTGQVILAGEIKSKTYIDMPAIARKTINKIGYTHTDYKFSGDSCGVITLIDEQSSEINQGVDRGTLEEQGAGDQGMMFGYATNETKNYMPLPLVISHILMQELAALRREAKDIPYLRPDSKAQVTIEYDEDHKPIRIKTIVVSTQHDDFTKDESYSEKDDDSMLARIESDIKEFLIPRVKAQLPENAHLFEGEITYHINPTGKFVIGGPHGDTGLTGRKIIVDTYGGRGAHGGGAFSGKDPSKVDRSAAYAARHIAKNLVAAGVAEKALVQISYAIGVVEPTSIHIDTYGTNKVNKTDVEIAEVVKKLFDLRPGAIEKNLKLRNPIYKETAAYGHMGREPITVTKHFKKPYEEKMQEIKVDLFTWEELNKVADLKKVFNI